MSFQSDKERYERLLKIGWHPYNRNGRQKAKCAECGMAQLHPIHKTPQRWREQTVYMHACLMQRLYGKDWQLRFRESEVPAIRARIKEALEEGRKLNCRTRST